jgi:hypothetical protein
LCDADANYLPLPVSSQSEWSEDEPLVEDSNMNDFRDKLAHSLFHGLFFRLIKDLYICERHLMCMDKLY